MSRTTFSRPVTALAALLVAVPLGACDFFIEDPTPNAARLVLSSGTSTGPIRLLMSTNFLVARDESGRTTVELIEADTLTVTAPFERTVDIRDEQQFFAQTRAADSTVSSVQMRVFLDGDLRYDETRDLQQTPLQFLYLFNRPILADVDVL